MSEFQAGDGSGAMPSAAAQVQEKAQQTAQQATQRTAELLRQQTEARASQASGELHSVAEALRRSGHQLHADGKQASGAAVDNVTQSLERLSRYLGETDADAMLHDVEAFGRRRPWALVGIGVGVGMVASRFLKASSRARYDASRSVPSQPPPRPALPVSVDEPVTQVGYGAGTGV